MKLGAVEILKFNDEEVNKNMENMSEENFEVIYNANLITRYIPVIDLKEKYVIRVVGLVDDSSFDILDPNEVNPVDQFELSESVTRILKKMDIKALPMKSDEDLQLEAFEAGKKKLKEFAKKFKEKKAKLNKGTEDGEKSKITE